MSEPRIKILDDDTIGKISAGEVVERPASVVKELVENSIDSGASRIEIEIKDGGKALIRVTDDGSGMTKEEAVLSLERHSTSKIKSAEDLFLINTLGFRGEALPSVAAISKLEMLTKSKSEGSAQGIRVKIHGGKDMAVEAAGCAPGTTVKVSDIFYNTPARKKYLKSNSTELSHIVDVVSKYVLAYPRISFKLTHNGEEVVSSSGGGDLEGALANIYGLDVARNAVPVKYSSDYVQIHGYVVQPTMTRIDKGLQAFFVNGRFIKNFLLSRALTEAYRNLIPRDRNPIAALFIAIAPSEVDVNVHPTKREIKFAKTNDVLDALRTAVSQALGLKDEAPGPERFEGGAIPEFPSWKPEMASVLFSDTAVADRGATAVDQNPGGLYPLCQILNTYIVASDGDGFILIDQHAAHERIRYEELRDRGTGNGKQDLLIPENLELNQAEALLLRENVELLAGMGFEIEDFGSNSFIVRSVPVQLSKISPKGVIMDIISEVSNFGSSISVSDKLDAIYKLIACHSAVRGGDKLSYEEMSSLLSELSRAKNPSTCPHGRPTMVRFTKGDLEKMFKRV